MNFSSKRLVAACLRVVGVLAPMSDSSPDFHVVVLSIETYMLVYTPIHKVCKAMHVSKTKCYYKCS
jgi:hypothetical protein